MAGNGLAATRQMSFSAELRGLTRDDHERVEQVLDLPWRLASRSDLASVLQAWGALWGDVRAACGPVGRDESARLLVASVRALEQIAVDLDDLDDLTLATGEPPRTRTGRRQDGLGPVLDTAAGVWAVSYVLRGSRVGGTVLAPVIAERLRLPDGLAGGYFGDPDAGRSWVAFRRRLDAWGRVAGTSARNQAARLAHEVFEVVGARLGAALPPVPADRSVTAGEDAR